MSIRLTRGIVVLGACTLWAACSKAGNNADTTAAAAPADTTAASAATTPPPATMTDTTILGVLDEANAADSAGGALAATKGTNAQVKSFGRRMERDHHKLRADGQALAKQLKITPATPSGDTLQTSAQKFADSLNAQPKGPAWDAAYMNHEVAVHQFVLQTLQSFQGTAQAPQLKDAITKAIPLIQAHLTEAQSIQGKLGKTSADSTKPAKAP
jgi:putative membrane protein